MATIKGTIYQSGTKDPLPNAIVKAQRGKETHTVFTGPSGEYIITELEEGTWSVRVIHDASLAVTKKIQIAGELTEADLYLPSAREDRNGKIFFWAMIASLLLLVLAYFLLHLYIWPEKRPLSQVLNILVVQLENPLRGTDSIAGNDVLVGQLNDLVNGIRNSVDTNPRIRPEDKANALQLADGLMGAVDAEDQQLVLERFKTLKEFIQSPPQSRFMIWTEEPLRMVEIMMWGLAGILVTKIIQVGWYLRRQTYQDRGFWMHLSHLVTTPLLVLVTVLLLSLVTLQVTLAGNNEVTIDLSDPRIMVAFAFIIGTSPWPLWNFIENTAKKFTGSRGDGDDE